MNFYEIRTWFEICLIVFFLFYSIIIWFNELKLIECPYMIVFDYVPKFYKSDSPSSNCDHTSNVFGALNRDVRGSICNDFEYNSSSSSSNDASWRYDVTLGMCSILYGVCWKWRISRITWASCKSNKII